MSRPLLPCRRRAQPSAACAPRRAQRHGPPRLRGDGFPVYWMVATAFKQGRDVLSYEPRWLPRDPTLASFRDAIARPYFWDSVRNSLIVVVRSWS